MAPIDYLKKKVQSGKLEPLFFQLNGESIVVVPDGRKFLCLNCLVEGPVYYLLPAACEWKMSNP